MPIRRAKALEIRTPAAETMASLRSHKMLVICGYDTIQCDELGLKDLLEPGFSVHNQRRFRLDKVHVGLSIL